ncbi:glycosyltransferase family 2 protein [Nocardia vinacea]|uniref:glycosyltransferase family 2 protein n=1 Tax=Nocardia vinacea TaxID=96468 RepID=UPI0002FA936A|nr:glycosyltransferase family 2 protein [Nocardia vinacea]
MNSLGPAEPRNRTHQDIVDRDRTAAIRRLSDGNVIEISSRGPIFGRGRKPRHILDRKTFVPALAGGQRALVVGLTVGWLVGVLGFWWWWLQPEHRVGWIGFLVSSTVLLYLSCEPLPYLAAANRLWRVDPRLPVPRRRVAFVVTRAPSEPWEVAKTTLTSMLAQDFPYPYDVWLCDERPTAEGTDWCAAHGVHISSRFGIEEYHCDTWPRRTRCKEGNLAYFYDQLGYANYDIAVHVDCDHVPDSTSLAEMVRPFGDPAVGYVAAPNNCDRNAASSWSARGRVHHEAYFHGPVQLGHNRGLAPIPIGSHWAIRTQALADIGGIGPELLEDFSTGFLLESVGWRGAFASAASTHGNGPMTFSAMLVQEFQWTRSLTTLLLRVVPLHFGRFSWRLRLRYLYAMLFHTAFIVAVGCGLAALVISTVTGSQWFTADPALVLLYWLANSLWLVLLTGVLRHAGLLRPVDTPVLSWENWLYRMTRWPFIAWGVGAAVWQLLRPSPITIRVTPKEVDGLEPLPSRLIAPHAVLGTLLAVAAFIGEFSGATASYIVLALSGAAIFNAVMLAVCVLHAAETVEAAGVSFRAAIENVAAPLSMAVLTILPVAAATALFVIRN